MTTIFTVGHGNRAIEEFVALLRLAGVACVIDVRAYPASRRHPQFARGALDGLLAQAGIRYEWEGNALGGRRRPSADSPHPALKAPGLRAYAEHMVTAEFGAGIERLVVLAHAAPTAIMCAERVPSECHRYLISDFLVARGERVLHLAGTAAAQEHRLSPAVRLRGGNLYYDGDSQGELKL